MRTFLLIAALLTAAGTAQARYSHAIDELDLEIVSDHGRQFDVYPLRNSSDDTMRAYLEAVPQENYSIRVRNRGPHRIGLVIAVDGRNIISGRKSHLNPNERMYILGPWESATYSGWRASNNRVNRFYFTAVEDSYSAAFGDYSAMGVIAVAAYRERERYRAPQRWNKRDDGYERGEKSARAPRAAEKNQSDSDEAGTGYGDDEYSPSRQVEFDPGRHAFARYFLKYEWRETLCEMNVTSCYKRKGNRFWRDEWRDRGFAPPPPRRRWFSRWQW